MGGRLELACGVLEKRHWVWIGWAFASLFVALGAAAQAPSRAAEEAPPQGRKADVAERPPPNKGAGPVLFASEGLQGLVSVNALKAALEAGLGRELVSVAHPDASRAVATLWIAAEQGAVTVRMVGADRVELWQTLGRRDLGRDVTASVVAAVLNLVWQHRMARAGTSEIVDPFCPPGMVCARVPRPEPFAPGAEKEVLDPWDTTYRRFADADLIAYSRQYPFSSALSRPSRGFPAERRQGPESGPPARALRYGLDALSGIGVHSRGALLRYEVRAFRRFSRLDLGLSYVGDRGQPERWHRPRRAVSLLAQGSFTAQNIELDLGGGFGTFVATHARGRADVLPYLRGLLTVAVPVGRSFDFLMQVDVATMFAAVGDAKAFEQGLSLGFRHRL